MVKNSQYEVRSASVDYRGRYSYETATVDMDNGAAGIIGAELNFKAGENTRLFFAGGYMPGISNPSVKVSGVELGSIDIAAAYIRMGFAFEL